MKYPEHKTTLIFDLFFCVVLMPLLLILGPAQYWMTHWPLFFILVCSYMYAGYFIITRIHVPTLVINGHYKKLAVIFGTFIAGNYLLTLYPLPDMDFVTPAMSEYQTRIRDYSIAISLWLIFSLVLCYSLSVSFVKELWAQLLLTRKIENQRDKAKLAMFKAQISPHFLFNTLNSLYSMVIGTSPKAEDAFIKFTEILKYTYVTIENEWVALNEEADYIGNYIDLQRIRLNKHTTVEWHYQADNGSTMIPPMILLTFVENAFKYGTSTSRDCSISISLDLQNGQLHFMTRNSVMKHADEFRTEMPVGLENCRSRLAAIFPKRHELATSEDDGIFTVRLHIDLNKP